MSTYKACASCCVAIVNDDTTHLSEDDEATVSASIKAVGPLAHVGIDPGGYFRCFFCGNDDIGADLFEGVNS